MSNVQQASPVVDRLDELTVYFDGACPVCSREIAAYQRQDGAQACRWVDASRCPDEDLGPGLNREQALARFHVRHPDGRLDQGMHGFAALWRTLPATAWLGRLVAWPGVTPMLDLAYRVFLRIRPLWRPAPRPPSSPSH